MYFKTLDWTIYTQQEIKDKNKLLPFPTRAITNYNFRVKIWGRSLIDDTCNSKRYSYKLLNRLNNFSLSSSTSHNSAMKYLFALLLLSFSITCFSQSLTGFWQGYITASGEHTKAYYAINVLAQRRGFISGRAYLYRPEFQTGAYGIVDFVVPLTERASSLLNS